MRGLYPWIRDALLLLAAGLLLVWTAGSIVARPVTHKMSPPQPPAQEVRLQARDGVRIAGSYWPGARAGGPAVLLLHGINNDRRLFDRKAAWLNGLGYAVLAIDLRGHGGSAPVERTFGWREGLDAAAAFAWLKSGAPARRIGIIGVSLGGAAALIGDGGTPLPAEAMVLHAVYPDIRTAIRNRLERSGSTLLARAAEPLLSEQARLRYGVAPERISPLEGLRHYRGTALIIGGGADDATRPADSRALYAAAAGPKMLWLVGGLDHVETSNLWSDEYRTRVRALFARVLGEPVVSPPSERHHARAGPFDPNA
jgi:dipeptidyl aminopeptidase/acylaminoacyl peptidase